MARVFEPPSRRFLREWAAPGCALALDLGCGPGHTTRLLRDAVGCRRAVGLEASAAFVEAAAREPGNGVEFLQHDVMSLPYPTGPAELIYARLLVSHLPEPARAIRGFASQLRPGGRLLLDEVESIDGEGPAFRRYLAIVEEMLASRGHCLYVGPRLEGLAAGLRVLSSERVRHPVASREAAEMFSLNLRQFSQNDEVRQRVPEPELADLAAELEALCGQDGPELVWGLRQLVIEV